MTRVRHESGEDSGGKRCSNKGKRFRNVEKGRRRLRSGPMMRPHNKSHELCEEEIMLDYRKEDETDLFALDEEEDDLFAFDEDRDDDDDDDIDMDEDFEIDYSDR